MKKLIFGEKESIEYRDEVIRFNENRKKRYRESGISWQEFLIKEELKWWGVSS